MMHQMRCRERSTSSTFLCWSKSILFVSVSDWKSDSETYFKVENIVEGSFNVIFLVFHSCWKLTANYYCRGNKSFRVTFSNVSQCSFCNIYLSNLHETWMVCYVQQQVVFATMTFIYLKDISTNVCSHSFSNVLHEYTKQVTCSMWPCSQQFIAQWCPTMQRSLTSTCKFIKLFTTVEFLGVLDRQRKWNQVPLPLANSRNLNFQKEILRNHEPKCEKICS